MSSLASQHNKLCDNYNSVDSAESWWSAAVSFWYIHHALLVLVLNIRIYYQQSERVVKDSKKILLRFMQIV